MQRILVRMKITSFAKNLAPYSRVSSDANCFRSLWMFGEQVSGGLPPLFATDFAGAFAEGGGPRIVVNARTLDQTGIANVGLFNLISDRLRRELPADADAACDEVDPDWFYRYDASERKVRWLEWRTRRWMYSRRTIKTTDFLAWTKQEPLWEVRYRAGDPERSARVNFATPFHPSNYAGRCTVPLDQLEDSGLVWNGSLFARRDVAEVIERAIEPLRHHFIVEHHEV